MGNSAVRLAQAKPPGRPSLAAGLNSNWQLGPGRMLEHLALFRSHAAKEFIAKNR